MVVVSRVALAQLPWELLALLQLIFELVLWASRDAGGDGSNTPATWKVSFSDGRPFGEALRTTVGCGGLRKMAFDILCMPSAKADLVR
jgi:hypothetical protein